MAGAGTVHQQIVTGDLSPLLFVGERVNRWNRRSGTNSEPRTHKSPQMLLISHVSHGTRRHEATLAIMTHTQDDRFKTLVAKLRRAAPSP